MKSYAVSVDQPMVKHCKVCVEANSAAEAIQIVEDMIEDEDYEGNIVWSEKEYTEDAFVVGAEVEESE